MSHRLVRVLLVGFLMLGVLVQAVQSPTASAAASLVYLFGSGSQTGGKQITLRVKLSEPAPSGGTSVALSSSSGAITPPATVNVPSGSTELEFAVNTTAVTSDATVTVSATLAGVTKSRSVLIKAPVLSSLGLQSVIRHGGSGKVIARISGPAPSGGFAVTTATDPAGYLQLANPLTIPAGQTQVSLAVPASLFAESNGDTLLPDQPVSVTISAGSASFTRSTVIRDFGDDPRPTPTVTPVPTATVDPISAGCRTLMNGEGYQDFGYRLLVEDMFSPGDRVTISVTGTGFFTWVVFDKAIITAIVYEDLSAPDSREFTFPNGGIWQVSIYSIYQNITLVADCEPAVT